MVCLRVFLFFLFLFVCLFMIYFVWINIVSFPLPIFNSPLSSLYFGTYIYSFNLTLHYIYQCNIITDITLDNLALSKGHTYFSTLTVCNSGGLCQTAHSDGVIPDPSPPSAGRLLDGLGPEDIDFACSKLVNIA